MKQNKSSRSTVLLFLLGAALIVAALIMLVPDLLNYKQSNDTYEALKENYISEKAENTEVAEETEGDDSWWYTDVDVKLEELQQVNADIIGWIRFDNLEQLSYPVLYSGDDEKYLRTDIYGNQTIAGCIFMEGMNTPDFQDYHTILYGHNMKNLSMFGSLKKYKTEDFYKDHQFFTIYTSECAYRYQIFAYYDVPETDEVYTVGFAPDDTFQKFIDKFIDGFNTCKQVFIITSKEKEIVNHIIKNIDRGCTVLNGNGGYTGSDVKIIYTVLNSNQFIALKKHVKEIDPAAFLTVNDSTEVLGEGFKAYE